MILVSVLVGLAIVALLTAWPRHADRQAGLGVVSDKWLAEHRHAHNSEAQR